MIQFQATVYYYIGVTDGQTPSLSSDELHKVGGARREMVTWL